MPVTRGSFKGDVPSELTEARQRFQPDDMYGAKGDDTEALLKQLGAEQNAPGSRGEGDGPPRRDFSAEPGGDPRRAGTAQPVPEGNSASTGANGPLPAGAAGMPGPSTTGAGQGSKIVKTYNSPKPANQVK